MHTIKNHPQLFSPDIIFFDDFTSDHLDRSMWNVEISGETVNNEQQAYVDSPETIYIRQGNLDNAHGVLVLHPRYSPGFATPQGTTFDLISARINTRDKMQCTLANISARISLSAGPGIWPAFWTLGIPGQWPLNGEIDIMENVGEPDWTSVAVHGPGYSGETPLVNKKFFQASKNATNWHIYSLECTSSDGLIFKVDGELIYRATRPMVEYYGSWVFDSSKFLVLNLALGGTYPFKTNGIHQPYYGLAEETVRSIQRNEIKMLVDWVKVTKV